MRTSQKWFEHFSANIQIKRVDWLLVPSLKENERKNIVKSVQAWQLGETSDGFHLLKASRKYAIKIKILYRLKYSLFISL